MVKHLFAWRLAAAEKAARRRKGVFLGGKLHSFYHIYSFYSTTFPLSLTLFYITVHSADSLHLTSRPIVTGIKFAISQSNFRLRQKDVASF